MYSFTNKPGLSLSNDQSEQSVPYDEGLFVNPGITFQESGYLTKLEFIGFKLGVVKLMVGNGIFRNG